MTEAQYRRLAENFCDFAGKQIEFQMFIPSANQYRKAVGTLRGIGVDCNAECAIIANSGHRYAIHYSNIKLPYIR